MSPYLNKQLNKWGQKAKFFLIAEQQLINAEENEVRKYDAKSSG